MGIGNILLLVLLVVAHAIFFRRVILVFRIINLGTGSLGFDEIPGRVKNLLIKGFGQRLVLREPSGIGHFCIFWGFMFLTFGTIEGLINGLTPNHFTLSFLGPIYYIANTGQDLLAVAVLIALTVAVYRRLIIRPKRLEGSFSHTLDALFIVGLIAILVCAYFGLRIIEPKAGFMPASDFLRGLILGSDGAGLEAHATAYFVLEWVHNIVILAFLVYIPYSKHLHLVTALPNLFFRQEFIRGSIDNLDLEDEDAESFGTIKLTDYSAKAILDVMACTECGRCQEACPAYATGKPLSPKKVVLDLKDYALEIGPALLKDPEAEIEKELYGGVIAEDVLWACTTCRACEEVCPVEIRPMTKLIGIRQARVLMEGDFPEEAQLALRNVETQSNPWGLAQDSRGDWCKDLDVKTLAEDPEVEYLFFVGCAGSYDQRYIEVSRALVKIMKEAGLSFGILGAEEMCTGDSAKRIGNEMLAQMMAQANVETMNGYNVKKIITSCPHCFNSIKNEFPPFGGEYEVIHHAELIADLIKQGKIKPNTATEDGTTTFHDSCYLGRYNDILASPRDAIKSVTGKDPVEMPRHGKKSFCCGAGGGRMWMEETIGTTVNGDRSKEAIATGATTVATACPFCMTMLTDGIKGEEREDIKVKDIAEIVADSL